MTILTTCVPQV